MTTYENIRVTGYEHGCSAAHAVEITPIIARQYLNGVEPTDPYVMLPPAPLSGEWAGESLPELLGELAYDEAAQDDYEEGFYGGWEDTMTARCHDLLI